MPKFPRIDLGALEVKHAVILWKEVQVACTSRDAYQFRDHAFRVGNRVQDVPANREIETLVGRFQFEHALVFERQAGRKACIARSRQVQVMVDDIYSENVGSWKKIGQSGRYLARSATRVEYPAFGREPIAPKQFH